MRVRSAEEHATSHPQMHLRGQLAQVVLPQPVARRVLVAVVLSEDDHSGQPPPEVEHELQDDVRLTRAAADLRAGG